MKNITKYMLMAALGTTMLTACSDEQLDLDPTTYVSTNQLLSSTDKSIALLNGIYRTMYDDGYTDGWEAEEAGLASTNLAADLMGEDMIMNDMGSGWYFYDYLLWTKEDYTHDAGRPYGVWNQCYTWIANANMLIGAKENMAGSKDDVNYIVGQAYAIRAFGYYMLSQWYARTLRGHEDEDCVPIYTEPTVKGTQGKKRATVSEVYKQIDADLLAAEQLLENSDRARDNKSHLGLVGTYGIHARVALVEEAWETAVAYADKAIAAAEDEGLGIAEVSTFIGMNKSSASNVIWGATITADQVPTYNAFLTHMDWHMGAYGDDARKQINRQLYNKMGENDTRRAWWNPEDENNFFYDEDGNIDYELGYQQEKFLFSNYKTFEGDNIFMRVEEMYLIKAEAECMKGDEAASRATLKTFMDMRDPDFAVESLTGKEIGATSAPEDETGSLREAIITQRRIELWGEFGRIYDLRRLHQGYIRTEEQGHYDGLDVDSESTQNGESVVWLMPIPQSEFDGNVNLDPVKDQNPWEDE